MINPDHIEDFQHYIYRRMEAYNDELVNDPEYKKLSDWQDVVMEKIEPLINEDLFAELDSLFAELESLFEKHGFKMGLRDGYEFRQFVDSLALPATQNERRSS